MSTTQRHLSRRHLERLFRRLRPAEQFRRPPKGWVRAIRDSLGMTARQLGQRMGLTQPAVASLEKGETAGTTTLSTLQRAAEAMDCTLIYALVPNRSLEEMVQQQALRAAAERVGHTAHTMTLENQAVSQEQINRDIKRIADDILRRDSRSLWQEHQT